MTPVIRVSLYLSCAIVALRQAGTAWRDVVRARLAIARHSSAQRRHAAAHCWQCSIFACRAHSLPQASQISAHTAQIARHLAATSHVGRRESADLGAVHVERDASRHLADVLFLQAGGRAVIAGVCALVAGGNAGRVVVVGHGWLLIEQ
jgi:hypothetical protein